MVYLEKFHNAEAPRSLLWVDCEFTGLSIEGDRIVEVAAVATDSNLNTLAQYSTFISQDPVEAQGLMLDNVWWRERPHHMDKMLEGIRHSESTLGIVDSRLADFAIEHCGTGKIILSGNSIHNDRRFIDKYLPKLSELLHYRMLDVSSLKILGVMASGLEVVKAENHRALEDVFESIHEMREIIDLIGNNKLKKIIRGSR